MSKLLRAFRFGRRLLAIREERRKRRTVRLIYESGSTEMKPPKDAWLLRSISDRVLHSHILKAQRDMRYEVELIGLQREQRRREAWQAPAGRAFWISISAVAVSLLSLAVTLLRG